MEQELQNHEKQGLCFYCKDKYFARHRCKKELNILLVTLEQKAEYEVVTEDTIPEQGVEISNKTEGDSSFMAHVSLNTVVELTQLGTIKVVGIVHGHQVIILID